MEPSRARRVLAIPEALERPLPKPRRDLVGYASARTLEALVEGILALKFLERGFTRNAAGKAFQAWRALTAAILALERDKIAEKMRSEEQRKWLTEKALPRVPSSRLKVLGRLVEEAGYTDYSHYTSTALDLHDYQYHGPDPDAELSKYPDPGEAARDTISILGKLAGIVENRVKPKLEEENMWSREHEEALQKLRGTLKTISQRAA